MSTMASLGVASTIATVRPLFLYGTLLSPPLLAWLLSGDSRNISLVQSITEPAYIHGYTRKAIHHADYPALVPSNSDSVVHGHLLRPQSSSQRVKADNFEGESYLPTAVQVHVQKGEVVDADVYVWAGDVGLVSDEPWDQEKFAAERLDDWLDLFAGMEMVGDENEA